MSQTRTCGASACAMLTVSVLSAPLEAAVAIELPATREALQTVATLRHVF